VARRGGAMRWAYAKSQDKARGRFDSVPDEWDYEMGRYDPDPRVRYAAELSARVHARRLESECVPRLTFTDLPS